MEKVAGTCPYHKECFDEFKPTEKEKDNCSISKPTEKQKDKCSISKPIAIPVYKNFREIPRGWYWAPLINLVSVNNKGI